MKTKSSRIHVEPLPCQDRGEWRAMRARVSGHPRRRHRNGEIYFEVPARCTTATAVQDDADDRHDTWLRAVIFSAMEAGRDLVVHGSVSASLLANIELYQRIISNWWPKYRVVEVRAAREIEGAPTAVPAEAVLTFSGGLDSIHSLYVHQRGQLGRNSRRIPWCVFVHGFDIPLEDPAFQGAWARAARVTTALGSELVPVRTNLRRMLPRWPESYPAALAATLSLFSRRFSEGLLASSVIYRHDHLHEEGYGSSATSDWLLSAHDFRVVHDVADATRVEKTRVLIDCAAARQSLRVCWAGTDLSTNCGHCAKCVWQMLCMRAVGLTTFEAFAQPLTTEHVLRMTVPSRVHWEDLANCLDHAQAHGRGQLAEFVALRQVLDQWRPASAGPGGHAAAPVPRRDAGLGRVARQLRKLAVWYSRAA